MNPVTLLELLFMSDFRAGLAWGAGGLVLLLLMPHRDRPLPVWGLVAAATVVGAADLVLRRPALVVGVVLLALGGMVMDRTSIGGWLLVATGSVTVAVISGFEYDDLWIKVATAPFIVVSGWLVSRIDDLQEESGISALLVGGTVFGVWATIPEPNLARVMLGVILPLMLAGWPLRRTRVGTAGAYALMGLLAVAIAIGGEDRFGSVVGAWATVGAFSLAVLGPLAARFRPWWMFGLHAVSVLVVSRVAGLHDSPYVAAAIAGPVLIATVLAGWLLAGRDQARRDALPRASRGGDG